TDVVDVVVHAAKDRVGDRLLRVAALARVAVDLLDPFEVDDRHDADLQVDVPREIDLVGLHAAVQALVEQQVGVDRRVVPRRERALLLLPRCRFGVVVQVQSCAAATLFAVAAELLLELGPLVGVRAEVAHRRTAFAVGLRDHFLHRLALVAVEGVAFDRRCGDALASKDRVEGALDRAGTGAARAGHGDDGVLSGHGDATDGGGAGRTRGVRRARTTSANRTAATTRSRSGRRDSARSTRLPGAIRR